MGGPHRYTCAKRKEIKIILFFNGIFSILGVFSGGGLARQGQ